MRSVLRELLAASAVMAVCGVLLGSVAVVTTWGVLSSALSRDGERELEPSDERS
jgi:hypothetical protein